MDLTQRGFRKNRTSDNIADIINVDLPFNWDKLDAELSDINVAEYSVVTKQEPVFSLGADAIKGQVPINAKGLSAVNLVKNGNFVDTSSLVATNSTFTVANNTLTITPTSTNGKVRFEYFNFINGNKYYITGLLKASVNTVQLNVAGIPTNAHSGSGLYETLSKVFVWTSTTGNWETRIIDSGSTLQSIYARNIMVIDLTSTFGAGNEPTLEQCDKMFAKWFGGIGSVNDVKIKSVGKNLFDKNKVTIGKYINSGSGDFGDNPIYNATDYICVKPNTQYAVSNFYHGSFYDINKKFIQSAVGMLSPSNAYYLRLSVHVDVMNTFQIEEGTVATAYEPYTESISPLPKMHSLPNGVKDEIVDGKLIKRVAEKTLVASDFAIFDAGTSAEVDWQHVYKPSDDVMLGNKTDSISNSQRYLMADFKASTFSILANGVYTICNNPYNAEGAAILIGFPNGLYANVDAVRAVYVGKKLLYELKTPIVSDLVTPLTVFPQGTISVESDKEITIPELTFEYPTNLAGVIDEVVDGVNQLSKAKVDKRQEDWKRAELLNGFTGEILYKKNDLDQVIIKFKITSGSTYGKYTLISTLPLGYRPLNYSPAFKSVTNASGFYIDADGKFCAGEGLAAGTTYENSAIFYAG